MKIEMISLQLADHVGVIPQCVGCDRQREFLIGCKMYSDANVQHSKLGGCAGRTHNRVLKNTDTFKVNPLKASKRSQKEGKK